jgi:hypothetical protein
MEHLPVAGGLEDKLKPTVRDNDQEFDAPHRRQFQRGILDSVKRYEQR